MRRRGGGAISQNLEGTGAGKSQVKRSRCPITEENERMEEKSEGWVKERRGKRNGGDKKKRKESCNQEGWNSNGSLDRGGKEKTGLSTFKFIFARVSYLSLFPLTLSWLHALGEREKEKKERGQKRLNAIGQQNIFLFFSLILASPQWSWIPSVRKRKSRSDKNIWRRERDGCRCS